MRSKWLLISVLGLFVLACCLWSCDDEVELPEEITAAMTEVPERVDYTLHVKPILSDRCFACHGPDKNKQQAGLRLDVAKDAYARNPESRLKAIVPGKPGKSELVRRILSGDPETVMPTPESHLSLNAAEKATLIRWITQGAEYKPHWAFVKIESPALPQVKNSRWARNEIDRFILAKLEEKQLSPSPEAVPTTLLKRVYMDLTGLPPTPAEVDAFLADKSPDAYEKVVDKLLASPHYGEHRAVPWLDLARYADTHGYQDDGLRTMWPYRDWVIAAFNKNLPYDKFITWQLAGDLLPNPTKDMLIATGFNRNHQQSQEGGIVPEEYRTEYVADRVNTFGKAFLGLTTECARCHDHKYDPVSQKDYFSLFAFFNNNNENGQIPYNGEASPSITLATPEAEASLKPLHARMTAADKRLSELRQDGRTAFNEWLKKATADSTVRIPDSTALAGHFTFDEADGKKLLNKATGKDSARVEGDDSLTVKSIRKGRFGKSRFIYGENAIRFPKPLGYFERNQPFTVSIWLKLHSPKTVGSLIHKSNGVMNGYRGWNLFRDADSTLRLTISNVWPENAIEVITKEKIALQEWVHVAFAYDGRSKARGVKFYLNGRLQPVVITNDNLRESLLYGKNKSNWYDDVMSIGRLSDQYTKDFEVDELKVYKRPLGPLEIKGLFTRQDEVLKAVKAVNAGPDEKDLKESLYEYFLLNRHQDYRAALSEYLKALGEETEILNAQIDVMIMKERQFPRKTYLLKRGVYDAPDYEVTADTPDELFKIPAGYPKNRLGLAQWLLNPNHPLFARVTVNRFWQDYFGHGLVNTTDDFGNQGSLPTHPALLDWLSVKFRESGWDVKAFQKLIVTSATYRQSSVVNAEVRAKDPENLLYSRGPSYRVSAEQIRDQVLAASGLLNPVVGGPSVYPYQPDGLWEALATRNTVKYIQSHGDSLYRRSMYTFWKRSSPPPMMLNFDAAERHTCSVKRQKTSTPLQALVTLNDPQFVEAARVLAQHAMENGVLRHNPEAIFSYFYKSLAGRAPRPVELEILHDLYRSELEAFRKNSGNAARLLRTGEIPVNSRLPQDQLAAYAVVASTLMNFDEVIIKR